MSGFGMLPPVTVTENQMEKMENYIYIYGN